MLFNSYLFIFLFLPVTYVGFFLLGRRNPVAAKVWLAAASFVFYASWDVRFVPILAGSILFNFAIGFQLARIAQANGGVPNAAAKRVLVFGIVVGLSVLGYFKYMNFFADTINRLGGSHLALEQIILPLGISFFTFTQIAYLVDAYQGKVREYSFADYLLFVTYFPHLLAGPILHHAEMMPQFRHEATYRRDRMLANVGLAIFVVGLFKKVGLADRLAPYADSVYAAAQRGVELTAAEAWGGALAYNLQMYFDFSGYSDMAVGLSLLFGIRLPVNFAAPLQATSLIDLWRRWHITMSRFFRDYLYVPMGGNKGSGLRTAVNLTATMLLAGLWHGAGWIYVIFGALQGILLTVNHYWRKLVTERLALTGLRKRLYDRGSHLFTYFIWLVSLAFFRSADLDTAGRMFRSMLGGGPTGATAWFPNIDLNWRSGILWMAVMLAIAFFGPAMVRMFRAYKPTLDAAPFDREPSWYTWQPNWRWAAWLAVLLVASLMMMTRTSPFLYFAF